MRKSKISIKDLKSQISSLQDKLEREEQKLNCEIGAWVRQKIKVDSLQDFQNNFVIIPRTQTEKDGEKISHTQSLKIMSAEEKKESEELRF